jgi:hypothetical protein
VSDRSVPALDPAMAFRRYWGWCSDPGSVYAMDRIEADDSKASSTSIFSVTVETSPVGLTESESAVNAVAGRRCLVQGTRLGRGTAGIAVDVDVDMVPTEDPASGVYRDQGDIRDTGPSRAARGDNRGTAVGEVRTFAEVSVLVGHRNVVRYREQNAPNSLEGDMGSTDHRSLVAVGAVVEDARWDVAHVDEVGSASNGGHMDMAGILPMNEESPEILRAVAIAVDMADLAT